MSTEQFDEILRRASRDVNFGPLNGFGGYGSERVLANLPAPLQAVYRKWRLPTAILSGYAPGPCVRDYAGACGIDVAGDLAEIACPLPVTPDYLLEMAKSAMQGEWYRESNEDIWQSALTKRLQRALPDIEITREAFLEAPPGRPRRIDILLSSNGTPLLGVEVKTAQIQMADARQVIAYAAVLPAVILVSRCIIPDHILASLPDNCHPITCWRNGLGQAIK